MSKQEEIREIKQGLKEISEGKVIPLSEVEAKADKQDRPVCPECGDSKWVHNRQIGSEFKGGEVPCPTCTGRVDSPDREKIAEKIYTLLATAGFLVSASPSAPRWANVGHWRKEKYRGFADEIIALFPDEEAIKQEVWTRYHSVRQLRDELR